jgi:hypothetical protein
MTRDNKKYQGWEKMNSFALQLRSNLPEKNRSRYNALKKSGRLENCREKGERAAEQMDSLLKKGFRGITRPRR